MLCVRGGVVGRDVRGLGGELVGGRLHVAPAEPIANPSHTRQRRQVGEVDLAPNVIAGEPGDGGVDRHGRIGGGRPCEGHEHGGGRCAENFSGDVKPIDAIPSRSERAERDRRRLRVVAVG
ncbi:MAG: hypothetical protein R3C10_09295 [Pirellulales bacterium]